ncbi:protein phosphatase 1 regulatory subunit 14C [Austrofundulus limnaeus]|uniref:Protein phosphatase 1 regulatory subunit 14C n=1 Tax=Austrofundulus limnaeus TaxID=52670 RepID=A0A2I4BI66_AUSLI|nr:PREDICTED: protein phosphatase 1 regulatory subunit 14C [Austrofundulus limnaeus]
MSAASTETSASPLPSDSTRVFFQGAPPGVGCRGSEPIAEEDTNHRKQGKVTVRYDRKELRKRLQLEEWIVEKLSELYDCEEDEMPEVEIDIDELLEFSSDEERISKLQVALIDCYKPVEDFVCELLCRIKGMRKLSITNKKDF